MKKIFIIIIFLLSTNSYSEDVEKQYKSLIEELRCMVCQNQNLAESEAPLAVDMKQKIKEMLESGKNKEQIKIFLSERYSSYILYEEVNSFFPGWSGTENKCTLLVAVPTQPIN